MHASRLAVLALVILTLGCYHATIETGLPASTTVVQNNWAHAFIAGLVPPSVVDVASECPNGVARVETQLSFLNGLAAAVTSSLYTPMTITVTCAAASAGGADGAAPEMIDTDGQDLSAALTEAAMRSWTSLSPVYVRTGTATVD
jgi:hypothetical protein